MQLSDKVYKQFLNLQYDNINKKKFIFFSPFRQNQSNAVFFPSFFFKDQITSHKLRVKRPSRILKRTRRWTIFIKNHGHFTNRRALTWARALMDPQDPNSIYARVGGMKNIVRRSRIRIPLYWSRWHEKHRVVFL